MRIILIGDGKMGKAVGEWLLGKNGFFTMKDFLDH